MVRGCTRLPCALRRRRHLSGRTDAACVDGRPARRGRAPASHLGWWCYWLAAWLSVAALLAYEHSLVRPGDLRRLNAAFFTVNGSISVVFSWRSCWRRRRPGRASTRHALRASPSCRWQRPARTGFAITYSQIRFRALSPSASGRRPVAVAEHVSPALVLPVEPLRVVAVQASACRRRGSARVVAEHEVVVSSSSGRRRGIPTRMPARPRASSPRKFRRSVVVEVDRHLRHAACGDVKEPVGQDRARNAWHSAQPRNSVRPISLSGRSSLRRESHTLGANVHARRTPVRATSAPDMSGDSPRRDSVGHGRQFRGPRRRRATVAS